MRISDLDGITYIRIVSLEQEAAEREAERFRDLWEPHDEGFLLPPHRSIAIKVWALLKCGPLTILDIAEQLRCREAAAYKSIFDLRKHGQRIINPRNNHREHREYELLAGPPLKIIETPRGLHLAPLHGRVRANEALIELK